MTVFQNTKCTKRLIQIDPRTKTGKQSLSKTNLLHFVGLHSVWAIQYPEWESLKFDSNNTRKYQQEVQRVHDIRLFTYAQRFTRLHLKGWYTAVLYIDLFTKTHRKGQRLPTLSSVFFIEHVSSWTPVDVKYCEWTVSTKEENTGVQLDMQTVYQACIVFKGAPCSSWVDIQNNSNIQYLQYQWGNNANSEMCRKRKIRSPEHCLKL